MFDDEAKYEMIAKLSEQIAEKCKYGNHMNILNEQECVLYYVTTLEEEINNGGFGQFFWNSCGDTTRETIGALQTIHAEKMYHLFEEAIRVFSNGTVPKDWEERQIMVEKLQDTDAWEKIDQRFYTDTTYENELLDTEYGYVMQFRSLFRNGK